MGRFTSLMTLDIYRSVLRACPVLMRPIIRILLKAGVNYKQFAKLTREVYVDVATEDFGISGRKTNTSRVAILTGISRSEVTKLRKKTEEDGEIELPQTVNNAGRLLSGWHTDKEFQDANGAPKLLRINGEEPSFATLMNLYGGDIPTTAMLKELISVKAVEQLEDGSIKALKRYFMPVAFDENRIFNIIDDLVDISNTSYENLVRDHDEQSYFQAKVTNDYVSEAAFSAFQKMAREKGFVLLEEFDDWLANNEVSPEDAEKSKQIRLGLGMYFIHNKTQSKQHN